MGRTRSRPSTAAPVTGLALTLVAGPPLPESVPASGPAPPLPSTPPRSGTSGGGPVGRLGTAVKETSVSCYRVFVRVGQEASGGQVRAQEAPTRLPFGVGVPRADGPLAGGRLRGVGLRRGRAGGREEGRRTSQWRLPTPARSGPLARSTKAPGFARRGSSARLGLCDRRGERVSRDAHWAARSRHDVPCRRLPRAAAGPGPGGSRPPPANPQVPRWTTGGRRVAARRGAQGVRIPAGAGRGRVCVHGWAGGRARGVVGEWRGPSHSGRALRSHGPRGRS